MSHKNLDVTPMSFQNFVAHDKNGTRSMGPEYIIPAASHATVVNRIHCLSLRP